MNAPTIRTSHIGELVSELTTLTARIMRDGPTIATAKRAGVVGELIAAHLDAVVSINPRRPVSQEAFKKTLSADSANHVRYLRRTKGLTQMQLIRMADLSPSTVNSSEKVRNDPRLSTMLSIANVLQTPAAEIWPALKACKVSQ